MVPSPNPSNVDGCTSGTFSNGVDNSNNTKRMGEGGWLSGLGLNSGSSNSIRSSPRSRRTSGLSISSPRQQRAIGIANDIRNDRELFFADDEPISLPPANTTAACHMGHMMLSSGYNTQHNSPYHRPIEPRHQHTTNSRRRSSVMSSRSSQQKLEILQREVDMALEFFHQETEAELDEVFDGDDYLMNRHTASTNEKFSYQPVGGKKEPLHCDARRSCGSGSDECCDGDDSFPGTVATSMATSVTTYADSENVEFDDCQFNKYLSLPEQASSPNGSSSTRQNSSSSEPSTPKISGSSTTGLSLKKHKTKSIIQLPLSLIPSQTAMNCTFDDTDEMTMMDVDDESIKFEDVIANVIAEELSLDERRHRSVDFNKGSIRNALEPFLTVARK